jgi:hypothetical protein
MIVYHCSNDEVKNPDASGAMGITESNPSGGRIRLLTRKI